MVLEVADIGSHAIHLLINMQLDYVPRQFLSTSLVRDTSANTLLSSSVANPFRGLLPNSSALNGATVALRQLLIPFPQYPVGSGTGNGMVLQANNAGSSYFQSLNVRLQKRFTNGLTLINNFIWNRLIDRLAYLNDSDMAPERGFQATRGRCATFWLRPISADQARTQGEPQARWLDFLVGGWGLKRF